MNTILDAKPVQTPPPPPPSSSSLSVVTLMLAILGLLGVGFMMYDSYGTKKELHKANTEISNALKRIETQQQRLDRQSDNLNVLSDKLGITKAELDKAHEAAAALRREQERRSREFAEQLKQKAGVQDVAQLKEETTSKFGAVSTEVGAVKTDVVETRKELESTRRELVDVRETLSSQIARNRDELATLRRKGERDYFEFDINRKVNFLKVADIAIKLEKADQKKKKFTVTISVDDNTLQKKDQTVNSPVQFLVGKDRLRYELVVNEVTKDRIVGYVSVPKDKALSSEKFK